MKQLEELASKVGKLLEKNKMLEEKIYALDKENKHLGEQNNQLQTSLLNQNSHVDALTDEKDTIKSSIEQLLKTINALDTIK